MMYSLIRLIISIFMLLIIRRIIIKKHIVISNLKWTIIVLINMFGLNFLLNLWPVENYFITFNSSEKVHKYIHLKEIGKVDLRIEGENSELLITDEKEFYYFHKVAKNSYKIDKSLEPKIIYKKTIDNCYISVERYKNYEDYYIVLLCHDNPTIIDSNRTVFYIYDKKEYDDQPVLSAHVGYVHNMDKNYYIEINEKKIYFIE